MQRIHDETHRAITELLESGAYRPITSRVIGFDAVPEAMTDLAERRVAGRVVVDIGA